MFTVIIVGTRGNQCSHLRARLPAEIQLREIPLTKVFRIRRMKANLVILTKFVGHAHLLRATNLVSPDCVVRYVPRRIGA